MPSPQELQALVESSNHLRQLHRKLTKVHRAGPTAMPVYSPVTMHVDDRLLALPSRTRKSALPSDAPDRIESEKYPMAPVRVDFVPGTNSRLIGRTQTILY